MDTRSSYDSKKEISVELLEHGKGSETTEASVGDIDRTDSSSRLLATSLEFQSFKSRVHWRLWISLATLCIIIGLIYFAYKLDDLLPYDYGLEVTHSKISCDLALPSGGLQNAFIINLRGATHLSFTQAKAIDVIWQLFAGAGGRFVLAWIAYKVFMDGMTRIMEQNPVSYQLYASLTFSTNSLPATYYAFRAIWATRGWRSKCFLTWFGISTIYMLGFPTLMSATAGYLTPSTAGYNMTDGNFITSDSPELTSCFNLTEGSLIGYPDGTVIAGPPVSQFDIENEAYDTDDYNSTTYLLSIAGVRHQYSVFVDLFTGFSDSPIYDATNTTKAPPYQPSPNSTIYRPAWIIRLTVNNHTYVLHNTYLGDVYQPGYCYNNILIPDLESRAQCFPETYFVWGFSSLLVYIVLSCQIVWVFGMFVVWLDANINSTLCRHGRKMRGNFRASMDVAEAAQEVLGKETCAYSENDLARELDRQPGIMYYAEDGDGDGDSGHIGLSSRRRGRVMIDRSRLYGKRKGE